MEMSLVLAKPSTCFNRSSYFHPLQHLKHDFSYDLRFSTQTERRFHLAIRSSLQPVPPPMPPPNPSSNPLPGFPGKGWIAGAILALLLPFLKNKWGPLLLFKKEAEEKLETIEVIAETLEKVADGVEQIAEDIGKDLPEGAFKRTALLIEDVAEKVEAAAHFTDSAIDKIQELDEEVESLIELNQRSASELSEEKTNTKQA
ncbi:uncharacterized protein LOC130814821 isoform X2 [Amaranthus tricolor]|uniref:uncharacterized protein LOC130814821 isoform X2 n=1 Tax=Amaranthus tricolor TaxID=29722 RepID=UPI00258DDAFC|nr:uncharacterized protein LOC130814821 isoform X2 [Amaranthus tricolor]